MNLIIAQVQRTMEGGHGSANEKPTVDKGTLYNMRCHVSDKTAYAEEEQPAAKGVEAKKPASSDNDDDKDSPTPAAGKNVDKAPRSPSYSHSSAKSQEDAAMPEKDPEDAVKNPPKTSRPKDGTPTAQPMQNKDGSASKPPSLEVSQNVAKIVEKHGYCAVDSPKKGPMTNDVLRVDYEWYKLQDKDKDLEFIDMVNRHASSLTLT